METENKKGQLESLEEKAEKESRLTKKKKRLGPLAAVGAAILYACSSLGIPGCAPYRYRPIKPREEIVREIKDIKMPRISFNEKLRFYNQLKKHEKYGEYKEKYPEWVDKIEKLKGKHKKRARKIEEKEHLGVFYPDIK